MAEWTKATVLKTVMLRTPVNEWLDPKKEAPRSRGLFLFQRHPHREGTGGGVLLTVVVLNVRSLSRRDQHLNHGDLV